MLKALLKKQLLETASQLFARNSGKKKLSGKMAVLYGLLFVYVFAVMGWLFFNIADMLCTPLISASLDWMYFAMMGMMATVFGVVGSVFTTYSGLYQAKDNELLLSMPIPPGKILFVRMLVIYLMSLFFEAMILIPTLIVYFMSCRVSALSVIFLVLIVFLLPVLALAVSCILGFFVAAVSSRMKNKNLISLVLSVGFMAVYFYFYSKAYTYLQYILINSVSLSGKVKAYLYPFYEMGRAAEGNVLSMLIFTGMVLALFGVVYAVLAKGFLKIATTKISGTKTKYREKTAKASTAQGALLRREFLRFTHSSTYMLNCGLGSVMMIIGAVALIVKSGTVRMYIDVLYPVGKGELSLIAAVLLAGIASMNIITAPSVSLEGKSLWILRSMPVPTFSILMAKLKLHMWITVIPAVFAAAALAATLQGGVFLWVMLPVTGVVMVVFCGVMGLLVNLKMPNLNWTNETVAIKQSVSALISMFIPWGVLLVLGFGYVAVKDFFTAEGYLIAAVSLVAAVTAGLMYVLKTRGVKIFEAL